MGSKHIQPSPRCGACGRPVEVLGWFTELACPGCGTMLLKASPGGKMCLEGGVLTCQNDGPEDALFTVGPALAGPIKTYDESDLKKADT